MLFMNKRGKMGDSGGREIEGDGRRGSDEDTEAECERQHMQEKKGQMGVAWG